MHLYIFILERLIVLLTKKYILKFFIIIILSFVFSAQFCSVLAINDVEKNAPEKFVEMIYQHYADENFDGVYNNFLPLLKERLARENYVSFQKENFKKYNLKYSNIDVGKAEKITYQDLPDEIKFGDQADYYYKIKVSYQLNFTHLGQQREEKSEKDVYLAEKKFLQTGDKNRFYLIWNPDPAEDSDKDGFDE